MTTVGSPGDARGLARTLLASRLAGCVQMVAVDSAYLWKGEVVEEPETLLLIKTREELYEQLQQAILGAHPYETPEILMVPAPRALPAYLTWLEQETS
jgi:periplasmic divalent cation tolerance protein